MGGTDDSDNLVNLTLRQHYFAHLLLVKIFPDNPKLYYSLTLMSSKCSANSRKYAINTAKWRTVASEEARNRLAREKGFVDYDHACHVIWEMRVEDQDTTKEISSILSFPVGYIQRCLKHYATTNELQDQLQELTNKVKSHSTSLWRNSITQDQNQRRVDNMKATKRTPEFRQKISKARRGHLNPNAVPVVANGTLFGSIEEASSILKLHPNTIRRHIKNPLNPHYSKA